MKFLSPAISRLARMRLWRIHNWTNNPDAAQRDVLQSLVTAAQYTVFGKQYNFSRLFTVRDFKKQVPIHEYRDLQPYIMRMMEGEPNVLWNSPITWFAKSSGTTSDKSKFIPVSDESLQDNHYQASKDVLTNYYKNFPASDLLTGKGLVVGGSHQISQVSEDIQYGDLSAILMQNSPFWGQWLRTPELSIALLDEWENKIEKLAVTTADENVTSLAGVPTWTLLLLKRILEIKQKKTIKEVWPNLELYINGGVSFVPYREQFEKLIGAPINYLEIYNASEGFFAAQEKPERNANVSAKRVFATRSFFMEHLRQTDDIINRSTLCARAKWRPNPQRLRKKTTPLRRDTLLNGRVPANLHLWPASPRSVLKLWMRAKKRGLGWNTNRVRSCIATFHLNC